MAFLGYMSYCIPHGYDLLIEIIYLFSEWFFNT